jgi:hypothetical protein
MSRTTWLVLLCLVSLFVLGQNVAIALTPEDVLKLKKAGVSEETIQMMLEQEHERRVPSNMVEQGYATDHPGTWKLKDGRTITSTGKRQLPLHYPTEHPPTVPYSPDISPYIVTPPFSGWRPTPTPRPSPRDVTRPPLAPPY